MKILIVDDEAPRYSVLIKSLVDMGIERSNICISVSSSDARDKLEQTKFDLLILDLLIPLWPEDEPHEKNSEDLLTELNVSDELNKPSKIIGITADKSGLTGTVEKFEHETWHVVQYEASCSDWVKKIQNCVQYLNDNPVEENVKEHKFDLAIICALDDPELTEVLALDWNWEQPKPIDDHTFIYEGKFKSGGNEYSVCASHCSRMGMVATANKSASIINLLRPKVIVMTGICGGIKKNTDFGDVIFAECVWDYQSGKLKKEGETSVFEIAPHQIMASTEIRSKMELFKADKGVMSQISSEFEYDINVTPKLLIGPIATGAAVVADADYVNTIISQNRKVLGIEMEIYGLYSSVENTSGNKPKVFALKSVCDFADLNKDDDYQKYCSYMSANVMRRFLETFGCQIL
ncbi:histidine kinase [Thalassotalea profundi]|uniref:Histidine kinase n=2 Tax=Thalassotalea profundi TaxID=2036687 RepID=A0ABQ3IEV8_9GAMM|nr:histidine kinase [Thalassotalea profundi]